MFILTGVHAGVCYIASLFVVCLKTAILNDEKTPAPSGTLS